MRSFRFYEAGISENASESATARTMLQNVLSQELDMRAGPRAGDEGVPEWHKEDQYDGFCRGPISPCAPELFSKYAPPGASLKLDAESRRAAKAAVRKSNDLKAGIGRVVLRDGMTINHDIFGKLRIRVVREDGPGFGNGYDKWYAYLLPSTYAESLRYDCALVVRCMYSEWNLYRELTQNNATIKEAEDEPSIKSKSAP